MPRAEREREMLEAAGEVFAREGFHAASMDAIADAARISKPMLYNYFGSKEGLYLAYIQHSGQALLRSLREAASPKAPANERLRAGTLAFLTYVEDHRSGWAVLHRETTAQGGSLAAEVADLRERIACMLTVLLEDAALAHAFVGAGESLATWWLAHPEEPKTRIAQLLMQIARLSSSTPVTSYGHESFGSQ